MPHSEHSPGHIDCPACQSRSLVRSDVHLADMVFGEAFETWMGSMSAPRAEEKKETSVRYIAETSEETYREYAWALGKFFYKMRLRDIHDGHIRTYQDDRANCCGAWKKKCGQNRIHKEVGLLLRMLRCADVWTEDLERSFRQLPMQDTDVPRALEAHEQARLLLVMGSKEEWRWIHDYTTLALATCASTIELRMMRVKDINLDHGTMRVGPEASKNKLRNRTIPLESDEAVNAMENLLLRAAADFDARAPDHYILPFGGGSRRGDLDVTKPMTKFGLKDSWGKIRTLAELPNLRPYDLRHTAITNMALNDVPFAVIQAFAGHIGKKMQQHYITVGMQAKRAAARSMMKKPAARAEMESSWKIALKNSVDSFRIGEHIS